MPDSNEKNEKNNKNNNSLFLYTALIFIAAIIIILFAAFTQTHVEQAQPPEATGTEAAPYDPDAPTITPTEAGGPQGIAKTAAQLSQDNLELLEENRELRSRVDELEESLNIYEPLTEAYSCMESDKERAGLLLEKINADALPDAAKKLYDFILSNIQQERND